MLRLLWVSTGFETAITCGGSDASSAASVDTLTGTASNHPYGVLYKRQVHTWLSKSLNINEKTTVLRTSPASRVFKTGPVLSVCLVWFYTCIRSRAETAVPNVLRTVKTGQPPTSSSCTSPTVSLSEALPLLSVREKALHSPI
jgi:hypothetical protein